MQQQWLSSENKGPRIDDLILSQMTMGNLGKKPLSIHLGRNLQLGPDEIHVEALVELPRGGFH